MSHADHADNRRRNPKQQTPNNRKRTITSPNSLSPRNNAACCIRLRDLRYLRENIHIGVFNLSAQRTPICLSQISLIIADETQNNKPQITAKEQLPHPIVFLCEIMQLAAFLCVICVICERIFTQAYSINPHRINPQ